MRHTVAVGLVVALGLGCDAPGGPPREPDPRQDAEKIQDFGRPDATVGAPRDAGPDAWPPADAARDVRARTHRRVEGRRVGGRRVEGSRRRSRRRAPRRRARRCRAPDAAALDAAPRSAASTARPSPGS
ncbi:MAG: hypothetical protein R3F43_15785 [bacterium]